MLADLHLAIAHHLLVFGIFAVFAVELVLIKPGLTGETLKRLGRFDGIYGGLALAVLVIGFLRAVYGLKGWVYYSGYWVFWTKIGAFALVGILSVPPTLAIQRWRNAARANPGYVVPDVEIAAARKWMHMEAIPLAAIPILAAMLARGIGY